jgi:starch synthase (maltosyl-transferring)
MKQDEGRQRIVIEGVRPEIDGGRFAIKRTVGQRVVVHADILCDGHDAIAAELLYRPKGEDRWLRQPMAPRVNDRWTGSFTVEGVGEYSYTVRAWVDHFKSWARDLRKWRDAGQDVTVELLVGAGILEEVAARASEPEKTLLGERAEFLRHAGGIAERIQAAFDEQLEALVSRNPPVDRATTYEKELTVRVDREKARFSAWYELFPRSCGRGGAHGTFKECEERLPDIASMGFDVLYFPPIHPVGHTHRKGKNNTATAAPDDPGSPWAIGSEEGGHKAVHPTLGSLADFRHLVSRAGDLGIEVALDLAFQCSPDHPYVKAHPDWFHSRPDGSIQYAENPPKKYEDIYPLNFECGQWQELWKELKSVVLFWIDQGIRIFRVDNPHTKPFLFWEWLIGEIKRDYPETIFLAEAFTRPKVMYRLAKLGFSQSYTYFAWRNTKYEIMAYFTELTQTEVSQYFRLNLWPNTPDILTEYLQLGGRPAFMTRLILAATLGANYGIYGPAFEFCENRAKEFGSEEYLDSEKYETREWNLSDPAGLRDFIAVVNRIRRENPALQDDRNLVFHPVDNEQFICYSKHTDDFSNAIVVVVNLDPHHKQSGWVNLDLHALRIDPGRPYQVHDQLSDARYLWSGPRNYVELDPRVVPAQVFRVRYKLRTERDFDYFM